jgi:hypothetical protein
MKPHLVRVRGLWHCGIRGIRGGLGIGFTFRSAYDDWKAMNEKARAA